MKKKIEKQFCKIDQKISSLLRILESVASTLVDNQMRCDLCGGDSLEFGDSIDHDPECLFWKFQLIDHPLMSPEPGTVIKVWAAIEARNDSTGFYEDLGEEYLAEFKTVGQANEFIETLESPHWSPSAIKKREEEAKKQEAPTEADAP